MHSICEIFLLRTRDLKSFGIHLGCCGWHYFAVHNRQHSVIHFIQEVFEVFNFQILITEFKCLKRCVVVVDMYFYSTKVNWKIKVTNTFFQNKKHSICWKTEGIPGWKTTKKTNAIDFKISLYQCCAKIKVKRFDA